MGYVSAEKIRMFLINRFIELLSVRGLKPEEVPDDFDLLAEGIIDSFGIIEMVSDIEKEFGVEIDFEDFEPEEITIIGPFCRYVSQKSNNNA